MCVYVREIVQKRPGSNMSNEPVKFLVGSSQRPVAVAFQIKW